METAPSRPVTAADLEWAVELAVDALRDIGDDEWHRPAGGLEWDRWETVEHMSDDLFAYAGQLAPKRPPLDTYVPFAWQRRRPGGPANTIFATAEATPAELLQVLEACGSLLVAMVRTVPPAVRAHHVYGVSDPEGFAAMGIVETLVHTYDVTAGTGIAWDPPAELCDRTLIRLFPDAPTATDRWPTLLWATGRGELPGYPVLSSWRWDGTLRG
jgi:hypothetical protein